MQYQDLLDEVDLICSRLSERYQAHLVCRSGCTGCCECHISVFEVEANAVTMALLALPGELRDRVELQARQVRERESRGEAAACPFLADGRCAIYESRPIICRTQGLPLLYTVEDGTQEVDFCPLNFAEPGATDDLEESHLVPLEAINTKLALANLSFSRSRGQTADASGRRAKLSDLILQMSE